MSAMTDPEKHEHAALDVLALLRSGGGRPTSYDPGTGRWTWTARGRHPGRGKTPERITGTGEDELAAMIDLAIRLDERHRDEKLNAIDRRGRAAFLEGAEERVQDGRGPWLGPAYPEEVTGSSPVTAQQTRPVTD